MKIPFLAFILAIGIVCSGMTGCVSKGYINEQVELLSIRNQDLSAEIRSVRTEVASVQTDMESVRTEVEDDISKMWEGIESNQQDINTLRQTLERQKEEFYEELSSTQGAMARTADKLKIGKLLYEMTISDESVLFAYKKAELSRDAQAALDIFATLLIEENKDVFIEIQGHTDNIGSEEYNLGLAQKRAEAVMRYLHTRYRIPLHRMSTFSYGKAKPVVSNDTESGRAKNRRVVLVVME